MKTMAVTDVIRPRQKQASAASVSAALLPQSSALTISTGFASRPERRPPMSPNVLVVVSSASLYNDSAVRGFGLTGAQCLASRAGRADHCRRHPPCFRREVGEREALGAASKEQPLCRQQGSCPSDVNVEQRHDVPSA